MTVLRVDTGRGVVATPLGLLPCMIGQSGAIAAADKREGDGMTPIGVWPIRAALLRSGRVAPPRTLLPWRWLRPNDGWSDDAQDPSYNRPVSHPRALSAERLWRGDALYDVIVILGHNDAPPIACRGSAIFFHVEPLDGATAGCIAIARNHIVALLDILAPGDMVAIG